MLSRVLKTNLLLRKQYFVLKKIPSLKEQYLCCRFVNEYYYVYIPLCYVCYFVVLYRIVVFFLLSVIYLRAFMFTLNEWR